LSTVLKPSLEDTYQRAYRGSFDANGVRRSLPHVEYQKRPLDWIVDKLGIPRETIHWSLNPGYATHTWDGTPDPFVVALNAIADWKNVGIESANGPGKTFLAACLTLWFLACFEGSQVVTAAPKEKQLELHAWKEIGRLWPRFQAHFPTAELLKLKIRIDGREDWGAVGFVAGVSASEASSSAIRAHGFHAEHLLFILEEMTGILAPVVNAFFNTATAPHNLIWGQGNPDHELDQLHQHCVHPNTVAVRISALDHPNVVMDDATFVPGACSRKSIADKIAKYGEGSRIEASRNRGICPAEAAEALIKLEWVERAFQNYETWSADGRCERLTPAIGADVANSENGDKACTVFGRGPMVTAIVSKQCPNANQYGAEIFDTMQLERIDPMNVGIDNVGVGAGAVNELDKLTLGAELGVVIRCSGGAIENTQHMPDGSTYEWAPDANLFDTYRSQAHWQLREDLRQGFLALPRDRNLARQIVTPTYKTDGGKVHVERKDEIKKRLGGYSPNELDALVYWNWVRRREAVPVPPVKPDRDAPLPPQPRKDETLFVPPEYTGDDYFDSLPAGF
jgi:hypothetical protein